MTGNDGFPVGMFVGDRHRSQKFSSRNDPNTLTGLTLFKHSLMTGLEGCKTKSGF